MRCIHIFVMLSIVFSYNLGYTKSISEQFANTKGLINLHPDTGLNISQFLEKYNYPLETHTVTTEDGYILTIHRIPYGRNDSPTNITQSRAPVFLMHGVLCSSMDWLMLGPENALGLLLADAGYDVWLGNSRGNTHSRKHVSLDPDNNSTFWDFSFHEMGVYDSPAMIDYVLNTTKYKSLTYVGHSQGTTQFFAMASAKPEYNEKVNLMVALSPVAYVNNMSNPFGRLWAENQLIVNTAITILNIHELLPFNSLVSQIAAIVCCDQSGMQPLCQDILYALAGIDEELSNSTFLSVIFSNTPAGSSINQFLHYIQEINSGEFQQYDYGFVENLIKYKSATPPKYNTSLVTTPVAAYYAKNDWLLSVENAEQLLNELPNVVVNQLIEFQYFNHIDFIYANNVRSLLYDDVIEVINNRGNYTHYQ